MTFFGIGVRKSTTGVRKLSIEVAKSTIKVGKFTIRVRKSTSLQVSAHSSYRGSTGSLEGFKQVRIIKNGMRIGRIGNSRGETVRTNSNWGSNLLTPRNIFPVRWNELDLFGRPMGKFTEPANFDENRARMGFGSEAET